MSTVAGVAGLPGVVSSPRTGVTTVPATVTDPQLRLYLQQIHDSLRATEAATRADDFTNRLISLGVLNEDGSYAAPDSEGGSGGYSPFTDASTPIAPTLLSATTTFSSVVITWGGAGQSMVSVSEVWYSAIDDPETATLIWSGVGGIAGFAPPDDQTYYYWVRFVSYLQNPSPWHDTAGIELTLGVNPVIAEVSNRVDNLEGTVDLRNDILDARFAHTALAEIETALGLDADVNTQREVNHQQETVLSNINGSLAVVQSDITTNANAISAETSTRETQISNINNSIAVVQSDITTNANAISAETSARQTLAATVDGHTSSISVNASAVASVNNKYNAQWSVKTNVNNIQGGVGFYNDGVTTQFLVDADTFAVLGDVGEINPFIVDQGNVYINGAYIQAYSIDTEAITGDIANFIIANIQDATITEAKLEGTMRSSNYQAGVQGWRVLSSGTAEFHDIYARGDIVATDISASAVNIIDTLMVQGSAITVSQIYTASDVAYSANTTPVIITGNFDAQGGGYIANFACECSRNGDGWITLDVQRAYASGGPWTTVRSARAGTRTDSGASTAWEIPIAMPYGEDGVNQVWIRVKAQSGIYIADLKNITLTIMSGKR